MTQRSPLDPSQGEKSAIGRQELHEGQRILDVLIGSVLLLTSLCEAPDLIESILSLVITIAKTLHLLGVLHLPNPMIPLDPS